MLHDPKVLDSFRRKFLLDLESGFRTKLKLSAHRQTGVNTWHGFSVTLESRWASSRCCVTSSNPVDPVDVVVVFFLVSWHVSISKHIFSRQIMAIFQEHSNGVER